MAEVRKFYTIEEANRMLPQLTDMLHEMQAAKARIVARRDELEQLAQLASLNGHAKHAEQLTSELDELVRLLNDRVEYLTNADIELRDIDDGLLDFPSIRRARMVWLCWKLGEPAVGYWHDMNSGFSSRQPL